LTLRFDRTTLGALRFGALGLGLRLLTLDIWPLELILTLEVRTLLAGVGTFHWRSLWRGRGDGWSELALRPLVGVARGLGWVDWLSLRGGLWLAVVRTARGLGWVDWLSLRGGLWLAVVRTASRLGRIDWLSLRGGL
jgi:hypothetical protein